MTRFRDVGGNVNESTGGSHKIFSEEKIVTQSNSYIAQKGEENGVSFGEPKQISIKKSETYRLDQDLAWLSMHVVYDDDERETGWTYKRTDRAYRFTLVGIKKDTLFGFRCFIFKFEMDEITVHAFVFMGTRPNNFFSLTDNVSQAFRASTQVEWAKQIGRDASMSYSKVIFAGHSKGGREAAQAAVEHGSGAVYSYNTSIAYLDDSKKVKDYILKGGVMTHFTVPGELLMMNKANGWNAGFQPTLVYGYDVKMRTHTFKVLQRIGARRSGGPTTRDESYYSREDAKRIGLGEQTARHSDLELMLKGLQNSFKFSVEGEKGRMYNGKKPRGE